MKVLILSSSREDIDPYYTSIARSVANFLASNECDLVFGGASYSMMGICYDEFRKKGRNISAYTTPQYIDDLKNLEAAKHYVCDTTFEMKQRMFENSDMIVCLPGGPGTLSELLAYIEEKRSNNKDIPIIIYDENGYYNKLGEIFNNFINNKFVDKSIYEMFEIARNHDDFEFIYSKYRYSKKR